MSGTTSRERLRNVQRRCLELHPGTLQDDAYLEKWCPAELFDLHAVHLQPGIAGGLEKHEYVPGIFGPGQCIRNATHHATTTGTSPWWSFSLYWEDSLSTWTWWLHSFCLSLDGKVLYDPTVPPRTAPENAPHVFLGVPFCWEVYRFLARGPVDRASLPEFFRRPIVEALPPRLPA